jgi:hypothetical protein
MPPTTDPTPTPTVAALVELAAQAVDAAEPVIASGRLVDALLDLRNEVGASATMAIDEALAACAHRRLVPTDEAAELVAGVVAAATGEPVRV